MRPTVLPHLVNIVPKPAKPLPKRSGAIQKTFQAEVERVAQLEARMPERVMAAGLKDKLCTVTLLLACAVVVLVYIGFPILIVAYTFLHNFLVDIAYGLAIICGIIMFVSGILLETSYGSHKPNGGKNVEA